MKPAVTLLSKVLKLAMIFAYNATMGGEFPLCVQPDSTLAWEKCLLVYLHLQHTCTGLQALIKWLNICTSVWFHWGEWILQGYTINTSLHARAGCLLELACTQVSASRGRHLFDCTIYAYRKETSLWNLTMKWSCFSKTMWDTQSQE